VGDIIAKYGVTEEDIFNFDETSFQIGVISTSKVITPSDRKGRLRTKQPGNRKWVTTIVTGAQIDMRFSGHVTAMPAGVASIPTAPSWRAACVLRARLRRPDC